MIRILGILFLILYMGFMYFIGGAFTNKQGSYAYQFLVGYMVFSACVALGGIIIQILNFSWWFFVFYLVAVYAALAFIAIGKYATHRIVPYHPSRIKDFFSQQWFMFALAAILTVLSVSHLLWIWGNNASDDGYYLSLVGALPYSPNSFHMSPSTGFPTNLRGVGSYIINTIYSEYSVYAFFTRIKSPLFCRVYMSFFNYFLFNAGIAALAERIFTQIKLKISKNLYQYACAIMLLFAFTMAFQETKHLMHVYDNWQFNTAMYYGSSIVRCMSILWIVVPFFDRESITWRDVLLVAGIALGLMSKSTIALPLMIIIPVSYLLSYWMFSKNPSHWVLAALLFIGYLTVSIFLGNHESVQNMVIQYFGYMKQSVLFIPCILIYLASFATRNKYIIRYNVMLLLILLFMVVNPINNTFETASVINFVGARALATWSYTMVLTCFIYLVLGLFYIARNDLLRQGIIIAVSCLLLVYLPLSDNSKYSEFFDKLRILSHNPDCIPASTVALGDVLEERYQETGKMNVVSMVEGVEPNGILHYVAACIRSCSPHTITLSAVPRFGADNYGQYQAFTKETQNNFNYFIGNPVDDTYNVIANVLDETGCNVVVMNSLTGLNGYEYSPFLARSGFELYKVVEDPEANIQYFVFVRNI